MDFPCTYDKHPSSKTSLDQAQVHRRMWLGQDPESINSLHKGSGPQKDVAPAGSGYRRGRRPDEEAEEEEEVEEEEEEEER